MSASPALSPIPKGARIIDCTGKFLIPGLIDGFAGMNSQAQANANLYMGVTTVVARADSERGFIDFSAQPSPHIYPIDTIGVTDNWSLLARAAGVGLQAARGRASRRTQPRRIRRARWSTLRTSARAFCYSRPISPPPIRSGSLRAPTSWASSPTASLSPRPTAWASRPAWTRWSTWTATTSASFPMNLQSPLVDDPDGSAAATAYDYSERIPPTDLRLRNYAHFLATHHAALHAHASASTTSICPVIAISGKSPPLRFSIPAACFIPPILLPAR